MKTRSARRINAKRISAALICCLMLTSLMPLAAYAEDELTYGEYTYVIDDSGNVTITDVDESIEGNVTVPGDIDGHTVTAIGNFAFEDCAEIISLTLPDSVVFIGDFAFSFCGAMAEISIPDGVRSIGEMAFGSCSALKEIKLPESLETLGDGVFYNCNGLEEIHIPDSVIEIGAYLGGNCDNLKTYSVSDENACFSAYDGVLFNKDKTVLKSYPCGREDVAYRVPEGVQTIGDGAFDSAVYLEEVFLPDRLKTIGHDAFYGCSRLLEIDIPHGVTDIDYNAFFNCTSLEIVYLTESVKHIEFWAFSGCRALTDVYFKCNEAVWEELLAYAIGTGGNTALRDADIHFSHTLDLVPGEAASCTEAGTIAYYVCSECGRWCVDPRGVTGIDDESYIIIPATGHNISFVRARSASCTRDGNTVYYACSACGKWFEDEQGTVEIVDKRSVIIPATGHSIKLVPAKDASCADEGNTAYYACSACGKWFEDEQGTVEITDRGSVIIPTTDHSISLVPAKSASCTDDGNTAYYVCSACDKWFEDEDCAVEITDKGSVVIPASGHTPQEPVKENEVAASCDEDGSYDEVTYCAECGAEVKREEMSIEAFGHDWGEWEETKSPTETEKGEETRTCKNDPSHTETREIPELEDDEHYMLGDVNDNGQIDAGDATMVLRSAIGMTELTPKQAAAADVNKNNGVDAGDATIILRHTVGLATIE